MLPLNTNSTQNQPQASFREAQKLMQQGKGNEALKIYYRLLETSPDAPEIHFQIGQLMMKALRFDPAIDSFKRAISLANHNQQIWRGYTEALIRAGTDEDISDALEQLNSAKLSNQDKKEVRNRIKGNVVIPQPKLGNLPKPHLQKALQLIKSGQALQAVPLLQKLIKAHPQVAVLYGVLGTAYRDIGQKSKAIEALKYSTKLDPNIFDSQLNLGHLLLRSGNAKAAISHLEMARTLNPKSPPVLLFLAEAYEQIDIDTNQTNALDRAIKIDPKFLPALLARAKLAHKQNHYVLALDLLEKIIKFDNVGADVYLLKSNIHSAAGDQEQALASIKIALELDPENSNIMGQLATLLQSNGDFDSAEETFLKAIDLNPLYGTNYRVFSASHKFKSDDQLIGKMESVYQDPALQPQDKMQLGFALSKAMEDIKQYDNVFTYLNASNAQMRKDHPYDIALRKDQIFRTKRIFKDIIASGRIGAGNSNYAPIFVTGMPRSGTTLVEQILSSHSTVTGTGELSRFNREALHMLMSPKGDRKIETISDVEFNDLANHYEAYVKTLHPESIRISDKSIQTYLVMGLVWCALPKAKIIVVRRDPRDNLLSVYKNVFPTGGHLYSYDMNDLGEYYRMFVEMIDFWRDINPDGFHEIWYEDLIANPEEESRKLVAAAGLEWEDACLNFHQNKRKVNTLSVYQVRQPIYKSSVKAWQRYEKELQPLFDSLGDLMEPTR